MKVHRIEYPGLNKTYATRKNAIAAVEKVLGGHVERYIDADVRYLIAATEDGRFHPVFIGESAVHNGLHFHFPVAA